MFRKIIKINEEKCNGLHARITATGRATVCRPVASNLRNG